MYMEVRKLTFNSEGGISNYAKPIYPKTWVVLVLAHMLAASKSSCTKRVSTAIVGFSFFTKPIVRHTVCSSEFT